MANVSAARLHAFDALRRVETEGAYASNLIASDRYNALSRPDHALLLELTLGVLRLRGLLDFLIEHYSGRKLGKLDLEVVIALRLGLYQLRFLTRIPAHAAINESVNLVRMHGKKSAAPFVNAILRSAQREPQVPIDSLEAEVSHPTWLLDRWIERFGKEEAVELAKSNNIAPRVSFRFTSNYGDRGENQSIQSPRSSSLTPGAFYIEGNGGGSLIAKSEPVKEGRIYLQDEASQLVAHLAAPLKSQISNLKFLDLCAAPGGKTTLIASLLPENSLIVAADLHLHRLRTMRELCERLGVDRIHLVQLDAACDLPFDKNFDALLLDAPCSGLGTLRRHPEIKWRMSIDKVRELGELQKRMIANAADWVKPGGLLTYSVCSTEPEEGEEVIGWFRRNHPEYRDMTRERLIELGIDPAPLLTSSFGARTFPHRQNTEGFFVCVLWKRK